MFRKIHVHALALIALIALCATVARADPISGRPVIESIEGDKVVVVITPHGNTVGEKGTTIDFGDRIKTGPHASAKVRYPDGSKLLIGRATEMEVQESKGGSQFNQLYGGEVRGIISIPKAPTARPRFVIRTHAAVMGVRGTDFVMSLQDTGAKADIHTIAGRVDVAKDVPTLMSGHGVPVPTGQELSATNGVIGKPAAFDAASYAQALNSAQPEFVALVKNDSEIEQHMALEKEADAFAPPPEEPSKPHHWLALLNFQAATMYLRQQSGGSVFTAQLSWNPELDLPILPLAIRGNFAIAPLKGRTMDDHFIARQIGLTASLTLLNPLILELGAGDESWGSHAGGGGYAMATVAWRVATPGLIDRVFLSASDFDGAPRLNPDVKNHTAEIRAGVGVRF